MRGSMEQKLYHCRPNYEPSWLEKGERCLILKKDRLQVIPTRTSS